MHAPGRFSCVRTARARADRGQPRRSAGEVKPRALVLDDGCTSGAEAGGTHLRAWSRAHGRSCSWSITLSVEKGLAGNRGGRGGGQRADCLFRFSLLAALGPTHRVTLEPATIVGGLAAPLNAVGPGAKLRDSDFRGRAVDLVCGRRPRDLQEVVGCTTGEAEQESWQADHCRHGDGRARLTAVLIRRALVPTADLRHLRERIVPPARHGGARPRSV